MKDLRTHPSKPSIAQLFVIHAASPDSGNQVLIDLKMVEFNISELGLEVLG